MRKGLVLGVVATALVTVLLPASFQSQTFALEGVVVDAGTNAPLRKALVELRGRVAGETLTDDEGRFSFPNVGAGTYYISATRDGYVKAEYGQRQWGGPTTSLVLQSAPGPIRLAMTKGGVISGRITDRGKPAGAAEVIAVKTSYSEGQRVLTYIISARTNDLGEYHLMWLPPGQYQIGTIVTDSIPDKPSDILINPDATLPSGPGAVFIERRTWKPGLVGRNISSDIADGQMHVPMLFPGVPDAQSAAYVEIRPGAEVRNIDIAANPITPPVIKGVVTGIPPAANGQPGKAAIRVTLLNTAMDSSYMAETDSNGFFEIKGIRPASYRVSASAGGLSGSMRIEMRGGRDADVVIPLLPGLELTGRVIFEGQDAAQSLPNISVSLRLDPFVPGSPTFSAPMKPDGTFTLPVQPTGPRPAAAGPALLPAIPSGDYRVFVGSILQPTLLPGQTRPAPSAALRNLYVKSIRLGDSDVLNEGLHLRAQPTDSLQIVVGSNPGSLEGRVVDVSGQPMSSVWVAVLPDNGLRFRIDHKYSSTNASGQFRVEGLPPGDYTVFAWEGAERGDWQQPEFIRKYDGRGSTVHIDEGGKATVQVVAR